MLKVYRIQNITMQTLENFEAAEENYWDDVAVESFSSREGHRRRKILMDSHPYGYKTSIFNLGAPHEDA